MSYKTYADIVENYQISRRLIACAAQEGADDPSKWIAAWNWKIPQSDWVAAWESYKVGHPDDDPGELNTVITDQMILSRVQALMAK